MSDSHNTERDLRRVKLVNMVTLPATFILVAMGFALSQPVGLVRAVSFGLLAFSVVLNLVTMRLVGQGTGGRVLRLARIYLNLGVNIALVYVLGHHWPPMWLILVLPAVSTAIYGSRRRTLVSCLQASAAIVVIHFLDRHQSALVWGEAASQVVFLAALCFLINESMRTGEPSTGPR